MRKIREWPGNAQGKAQKRPGKTLSLYLQLFLGIETAYNKDNKTNLKKQQKTANPREQGEADFWSYHIIILKYPFFINNNKKIKRYTK